MSENIALKNKTNVTIDIAKIIMAVLVVGIHTEPFAFNIWLDRIFGIATRFCVPFFFVASSYFFFKGGKKVTSFAKRIYILYLIWSFIYLPFDLALWSEMSIGEIFLLLFWHGNSHALWYLAGSVVGLVITYALVKLFKGNTKIVFAISVLMLILGCTVSTYAPLTGNIFPCSAIADTIGYKNGIFYAFPYMALGAMIADGTSKRKSEISPVKMASGLIVSVLLLAAESAVFTMYFNTQATVLWMSMLPCSYFLFMFLLSIRIPLKKETSLVLRKTSTLIYVSQFLFISALPSLSGFVLFIAVLLCTFLFSYAVIFISDKKYFRWMKYLY